MNRSMTRVFLMVLASLLPARAQTAEGIVQAAAKAMGGEERIRAVNNLVLEGQGTDLDQGFTIRPSDDVQAFFYLLDFTRRIDVANGRMQVDELRASAWPFAAPRTVNTLAFGIDGKIAYNQGRNGPARASEAVARDRRIQLIHHPLMLLRLALEPGAHVTNLRQTGNLQIVDLTTAAEDKVTVAFDKTTGLPVKATSMTYHRNLGDITKETLFWNYEEVGGLQLPKRLKTKMDKYIELDLELTKNTVNGALGSLAAPASVSAAPLPVPPPENVTVEEVGKGIWFLGGQGDHSVVFEFDDHLTLFEVPTEARALAVIAKARSLRPGKPLTQVIISHHHFDHAGGLRAAVSEGLTVITHKDNVEFFKEQVARKHTIVQDILAKNPKPLHIIPVDDEYTLKDKSMEVKLFHVLHANGNFREGTLIYAYVPRDGMLVQADLYDANWGRYAWADVFLWNL